MCCLFGIYDYRGRLTASQKRRLLSALATASEARGTDATGIAYNSNYFGDCRFEKHNTLPAECHSMLHICKQRNGIRTNAARLYEVLLAVPDGVETTPALLREQSGLTRDQYKEAIRAASVQTLFRAEFTTFGSGKNQKIRRIPAIKVA